MDSVQKPDGRTDPPPTVRHIDDIEWETIRWPGETGKMLFHPRPENPTEPNAGLLRFEKGSYHPWHRHDFAQVWYVLEGEFTVGGKTHGPGTMFFHGDPHCEEELRTETGGLMVIGPVPGADDRWAADLRQALQHGAAARGHARTNGRLKLLHRANAGAPCGRPRQ